MDTRIYAVIDKDVSHFDIANMAGNALTSSILASLGDEGDESIMRPLARYMIIEPGQWHILVEGFERNDERTHRAEEQSGKRWFDPTDVSQIVRDILANLSKGPEKLILPDNAPTNFIELLMEDLELFESGLRIISGQNARFRFHLTKDT